MLRPTGVTELHLGCPQISVSDGCDKRRQELRHWSWRSHPACCCWLVGQRHRLARALGHMLTCPEPQSSHAGMPGGEMRGRSHVRRNSPKSGATVAFTQPTAGFCTPVATCLYCIAAHRRRAGSVGIVVTNKLLALRARSFAVLNLRCRDQCNGFAVESTVQSSRVTARPTTIHAQVHQIPRSDRARSSPVCTYYPTAVRVCMFRRIDFNHVALGLHTRSSL